VLNCFIKSFGDIRTHEFRRVLITSAAYSFVGAFLLWLLILLVLKLDNFSITGLDWFVDTLGALAAIIILVLLLPSFFGLIASFKLETICSEVEKRHYQDDQPSSYKSLVGPILVGLRFTLILVILNIAVLPLSLIPPVYFISGWILNGYLLGREFFELVAIRYIRPDQIRVLRKKQKLTIFFFGLVLAIISVVPLLNLLLPIYATALMTHVFHYLQKK
jgi:CysZ protein|tara:strand:+ start:2779 stop:3435 length:657 start_codon:yes stop_codon:yes gene_type:complete